MDFAHNTGKIESPRRPIPLSPPVFNGLEEMKPS